jgi:hypothetical protein
VENLKITIVPSFIKGVVVTSLVFLIGSISISACDDIRIGKTKEELAKDMFEVDSLLRTIHMEMDSVAMDFNRLYIDAQRINNGSD